MGLLSLLFGEREPEKVELLADHIWLTADAKLAGIRRQVVDRGKSESAAIMLVAQFSEVLKQLKSIQNEHDGHTPILAMLASNVTEDLGGRLTLEESAVIDIIVAERHPLRDFDDELVKLVNQLPCRSRLVHHLSLDDATIKLFAGPHIHDLLSRTGMKADEVIESPLVSRQIKKAQQRIAQRQTNDEEAVSAREWMEKNLQFSCRSK